MMRNLKALGLIVAVMGVLGAMATPALAVPEFTTFNTSTSEHPSEVSIHGAQLGEGHAFSAGFGTVKCTTATFTGSSTATASSTLTVGASYSGCKGSFGETAHMDMNGCEYLFHAQTETAENEFSATVDLLCPPEEGPTLTTTTGGGAEKCVIHIEPDQEGLSTAHFTEVEGEMEVEMALEGIDFISTGGLFNCGIANGTYTNGKYNGNSTVTASEGEAAVYLQTASTDLLADPTSFKKKVGESENVKLYSKSSDPKLLIVSEAGDADGVFKLVKKCSGKYVTCTAELKCEKNSDAFYEVLGLTGDNKYTMVRVFVDCSG